MSKKTIAIFYIVSLVMFLVGLGLFFGGLAGSTYTTSTTAYSGTTTQVQSIGNPALFATGTVLMALAAIPHLISWIGALIALIRLQEWVWLVLMILFSSLCLLVYLIVGPDISRGPRQTLPQYAPNVSGPPPYAPENAPHADVFSPPPYPPE